jgi:acyl-CoA thioester hydrolase
MRRNYSLIDFPAWSTGMRGGASRRELRRAAMAAPTRLLEFEVPADWVDYNDHLNDAYHAVAFSRAGDEFIERIGLGPAGRAATGRTIYTLGLVIRYLAEAKLGERIAVSLQILETDAKRVRFWLEARCVDDDALISTSEQILICVDRTGERARAADFPAAVAARLAAIARDHANLAAPPEAGQGLTLRRRATGSTKP